ITRQLKTTFAAGRGAFKGSFENWSFNPTSRSAMRTPFIVILPHGLGRTQLAPVQFARVKDGSLRQIETLYIDIDLIKAHRIDDNEKSFFAEFYLTMRDTPTASIEQIEFTNSFLDPKTNGRQLSIQMLHKGGASNAYPETMKVYKVTGRFTFEPDLASFPFDTQRFAIELQPKSGDAPFIIQPPPQQFRNQQLISDGWDPKSQYVGYDEDFVPVVDAFTHQASVASFYKASFVWLMKRQTTDYYLRVVVPLLFIIIVAYLSIFIPQSHFEAIVTIQVTALLSAVALYISLPKLDSDTATVSDRIFVFDYMMVSLMIVISILRVNKRIAHSKWLQRALGFGHIVGVPLMLASMAWYVNGLSGLDR
ncbi:MAG: amino acid ABC transporter substrate-binding protein, partial [Hyphomicrobiaceae bacterium]